MHVHPGLPRLLCPPGSRCLHDHRCSLHPAPSFLSSCVSTSSFWLFASSGGLGPCGVMRVHPGLPRLLCLPGSRCLHHHRCSLHPAPSFLSSCVSTSSFWLFASSGGLGPCGVMRVHPGLPRLLCPPGSRCLHHHRCSLHPAPSFVNVHDVLPSFSRSSFSSALEARDQVGGRVCTRACPVFSASLDLGASIITGDFSSCVLPSSLGGWMAAIFHAGLFRQIRPPRLRHPYHHKSS